MKKLTKIIATIGPASESEEMIENLINAGANVIRFNLKHNNTEWHAERIERVRGIAKKLKTPIGILLDLQGPEVRIVMGVDFIEVQKGDLLLVSGKAVEPAFVEAMKNGGQKGFSISHLDILPYLQDGQKVVADDGAFLFKAVKKDGEVYLQCESAGVLKTRKTLNIPGADFPLPVLVQRDYDALDMAAKIGADFVALSFVRSADDVTAVREEMEKRNVKAKLLSKVETQRALDNLDEIIELSDGIMVARGDLAVEAAIEQVPFYQKLMIQKCIEQGKFVITATQMMLSMTKNPSPTRAEVSDVANAVYDCTDCVMLSEEAAAGSYPVEAVAMMTKILKFNESKSLTDETKIFDFPIDDTPALVVDAAYELYHEYVRSEQDIAGFLVFTQSGRSAQLLSRYRPKVPIFTFTPNEKVQESLTIYYGVKPFAHDVKTSQEVTRDEVDAVAAHLMNQGELKKGDRVIVLHGDKWGIQGGTSTVRIVTV